MQYNKYFLEGYHVCIDCDVYGDWRINEKNFYLRVSKLKKFLEKKYLRKVNFSEIGYKGKDIIHELNVERYEKADINYPCIISPMQNPYNLKYRMIDGNHRMHKMLANNMTESFFYVLPQIIILKFLDDRLKR